MVEPGIAAQRETLRDQRVTSVADLIAKAELACESASILPERGDIDGACNRAYYAMFGAARAALLATGSDQASTRTHTGLISAFGLHLVKSGKLDRTLGHVLNRAHEIRLVADYTGDVVDRDLAAWVVRQSREFVAAMRDFVATTP